MVYGAAYYKTLPFIVQLRAKSGGEDLPELETCFNAIYGFLMLKMQGRKSALKRWRDQTDQLVPGTTGRKVS